MIRIIKGSYGMRCGASIKAVPAGSAPIELSKEKEERLVRLGVAEYVGTADDADLGVNEDDQVKNLNDEDEQDDDDALADEELVDDLPEYHEDMKLDELKKIAALYGVDASSMRSKKEVIAAIDESKELPELGAVDPIE